MNLSIKLKRLWACLLMAATSVSSQNSTNNGNIEQFFNQSCPGNNPVVFAENIVSYSFMNHSSVTISKNMDEMYWSKWYDKEGREEIVFSKKINCEWTKPEKVQFSGTYSDDVPFLSPDSQRLYFLSRRPVSENTKAGKENIWYVERTESNEWSEPKTISPIVNNHQMHWQFSVSGNNNIYFSSDEGIQLAKFIDGNYQEPVLITKALNPKYIGGHPFISPNEDYIIFASGKENGSVGKNDLFIGYKDKTGKWCDPINLGDKINGLKDDMCPMVSPNEQFMLYVKHGEVFNINWVDAGFIKELKKKLD